jgi:hypothetical protein
MITDLIVFGSLLFALAFVAAWAVSPKLRARIETPKHRFQAAVSDYDRDEGDRRSGR